MSLLLALIGGSTSGTSLLLATTTGPATFAATAQIATTFTVSTTTGPAVLTADIELVSPKELTISTTTGAAVFTATVQIASNITIGTTTGPAVFNLTAGIASSLTIGTTTGPAVLSVTVPYGGTPDVIYLRVRGNNRTMGVNYNRFPLKVNANPRLMRVA